MPGIDISKLEQYADKVYNRANYFNEYTLKTIGRRLKDIGSLSAYDQETLKNIADISGDMEAITKELAKITELNVRDIENIYSQTLKEGVNSYKPLYDFKNIPFVPFKDNEYAQVLVKHWAKATSEEMINLSRTKALSFTKYNHKGDVIGVTPLSGAFQKAVDDAVIAVSGGTADINTVIRETVENLGGSGVRVNYGSGVTRRLDTVVRQNLLYGAKKANQAYDDYVCEKLGCDGFEVDYHPNPRKSHAFMGGEVFSYNGRVKVNDRIYEDGSEALERLEDYGCLHLKFGMILGVSEPNYSKEELKAMHEKDTELVEYDGIKKTRYEWKQAQRQLETKVRQEKDISVMAKAAGDNDRAKKANEKINVLRSKYDDLCSKTGLQPTLERMAVNDKKVLTKGGNGGIMKVNAGGIRNEKKLSKEQIKETIDYAIFLGMPREKIRYGEHYNTAYGSVFDMLYIGTDVYPGKSLNNANSMISNRGAIAHEIIGHRETVLKGWDMQGVFDEIQASIRAARFAPGLSVEERYMLIRDACERARNNGYKLKNIKNNLYIHER